MSSSNNGLWRNPPPFHEYRGEALVVRTGKDTDFWNNTFYGFRHGNGHFLATPMNGNFTAEVAFSGDYRHLYDQAGAMLRVDDDNWLKCGVEFTDGALQFSVVVTRDDQSDWSVMPLERDPAAPVTLRMTRHDEALRIELQEPEGNWRLVRLCFLAMPATVEVGPMACSPTREGLEVTFSRVWVGDEISRDLH